MEAGRLVKEPWPSFRCEIKGQEARIETRNVGAFRVDLGPSGLLMSGEVRLWVDGKKVHDGPLPTSPITVRDLGQAPSLERR